MTTSLLTPARPLAPRLAPPTRPAPTSRSGAWTARPLRPRPTRAAAVFIGRGATRSGSRWCLPSPSRDGVGDAACHRCHGDESQRGVAGAGGAAGTGAGTTGTSAGAAGAVAAGAGPQSQAPKPAPSGKQVCPPLQAAGPTHSRVWPAEHTWEAAGFAASGAAPGTAALPPLPSERSGLPPSLLQTRCSRLV